MDDKDQIDPMPAPQEHAVPMARRAEVRAPELPDKAAVPAPAPTLGVMLEYARPVSGVLKTIAQFPTDFEAGLASGLLNSKDIQCTIVSRADYWARFSAELQVAEHEKEAAIAVLSHSPARKFLIVPPDDASVETTNGKDACPACGSPDIGPVRRKWLVMIPIVAMAWLLLLGEIGILVYTTFAAFWSFLLLIGRPWVCRQCGKKLPPGGEVEEEE